jgi:hypothetical protein
VGFCFLIQISMHPSFEIVPDAVEFVLDSFAGLSVHSLLQECRCGDKFASTLQLRTKGSVL